MVHCRNRLVSALLASAILLGVQPLAAQTATPAAPAAPETLSGPPAWQTLVGNTIVADSKAGSYTEFFTPDGAVKHLDKDGPATGKWALQGDKICFDFPEDDDHVCTKVEVSGANGAFIDDDGSRDTFAIQPGNAKNL